jgi:TonB family protein
MRLFAWYLLASLGISTNAFADEVAFRKQVFSHLIAHHPDYPEGLKAQLGDAHSTIAFTIDRDGKLLDERVTKRSGKKIADQQALEWLKSLQPYPQIPAEVPAPLRFEVEIDFGDRLWNDDRVKRAMQGICKGC